LNRRFESSARILAFGMAPGSLHRVTTNKVPITPLRYCHHSRIGI
jgi:hypothetical protein